MAETIKAEIIERVSDTEFLIQILSGSMPRKGEIEILPPKETYRNDLLALIHILLNVMAKSWREYPSKYWPLFKEDMTQSQEKSAAKAVVKEELKLQIVDLLTQSQKDKLFADFSLLIAEQKKIPSGAISFSILSGEQLKKLFNLILEFIYSCEWLKSCADMLEEEFDIPWDRARDAAGKDRRVFDSYMQMCYDKLSGM